MNIKPVFKILSSILVCLFLADAGKAQWVTPDEVEFYTREWDGERDQYGRPLVSDNLLERIKYVSLEEAWGSVRGRGYDNKFEGDWEIMHPQQLMVGRALTAVYMPASPDLEERLIAKGRARGFEGSPNQWPIYMLEEGDIYVADGFGKIEWGPLIGENLGNAIYTNSGNGPVIYGSARNVEGLRQIEGFNAWVKGWHPTWANESMLMSINGPTRIGGAIVLPGDVVLATEAGVLFIPPHMAEEVVLGSEVTRITDRFRTTRVREGVYTLDQVYATHWSEAINEDFYDWVEEHRTRLHEVHGVGLGTIDNMLETRSRNWREWVD